jgi:hypothetical protein
MAAPEPASTLGRFLLLVALLVAAVLAVLILLTGASFSTFTAAGWLAVVLALYLASLLVP